MRHRIGTKLMISFLIGAAITVLVGVVAIVLLNRANNIANTTIEVHMEDISTTLRLQTIITDSGYYESDFFLVRQTGYLSRQQEILKGLDVTWTALAQEAESLRELSSESGVEHHADELVQVIAQARERLSALKDSLLSSKNFAEVQPQYLEYRNSMDTLNNLITHIFQHSTETLQTKQGELVQTQTFLRNVMIITPALAVILAILLGITISRSIARPVNRLAEVTKKIAGGDLTQRAEVSSRDELGELATSFNQMADSLQRDITERKKMQEQLIVTDRLASIGELVSGVAHEINNPLTGIIGFSDLLLDKDLPDDVKQDLEVINREAKRTAEIVKNLLTFARKQPAEKQSVDINSVIQKVMELRTYEQKVNNIQVDSRFAPDLPQIMADSVQLQQVFLNIIINAEQAMLAANGKGTFTVTTERVGDIIRTSLADDGPGITKENLGHVFDPFFTTKEVGKGTGLGLSISYGIITEHGGRIYAESKPGE